jgi:hypothetical protein
VWCDEQAAERGKLGVSGQMIERLEKNGKGRIGSIVSGVRAAKTWASK